jgi:protease-4
MTLIRTYLLPALIVAVVVLVAFRVGLYAWGSWHDEWSGFNASWEISDGYCNVAVAKVQGELVSFGFADEYEYTVTVGDELIDFLDRAEADWGIEGILLQVDSYGGSPSASFEVANRIAELELPVAAYIREAGTSAAYLIASAADTVIASPMADVGGIGITMSYLSYAQQNEDSGIEYVRLSSGEFKDAGSEDRPLSEEERAIFQRDLDLFHTQFVNRVAAHRSMTPEAVDALADGSSMAADLAVGAGLIDDVGGKAAVREWFASQLERDVEDIVLCR